MWLGRQLRSSLITSPRAHERSSGRQPENRLKRRLLSQSPRWVIVGKTLQIGRTKSLLPLPVRLVARIGPPALAIDLPVSTIMMLRSIADIARSEGERIKSPEAKLACLEVYALGGRVLRDDAAKSGYFAPRAALAKTPLQRAPGTSQSKAPHKRLHHHRYASSRSSLRALAFRFQRRLWHNRYPS